MLGTINILPAMSSRLDITVVDAKDRFVFLPLLYELATAQSTEEEVAPRYADIFANTGITFLQGKVGAVDVSGRQVSVEADGAPPLSLPFDRLVVALGSEAAQLAKVPGAAAHALPFYTSADARALELKLAAIGALPESERIGTRVVVVGGGYSGVELACSLGLRKGEVVLVHGGPALLPQSSAAVRSKAEEALRRCGVEVRLGTRVDEVGSRSVTVTGPTAPVAADAPAAAAAEAEVLKADLVVWTAGSRPSPMALDGAVTDPLGRLKVARLPSIHTHNTFLSDSTLFRSSRKIY